MPFIVQKEWYTEKQLAEHPDWLFVFGDNLKQKGRGGQAKVCRDKPNAFGIPTKAKPSQEPDSYFSDSEFVSIRIILAARFGFLEGFLDNGGTVIWPGDGIGTGLADLPNKAPKIWAYIQERFERLNAYSSSK